MSIQVGERLGSKPEAATILAQFCQHGAKVRAQKHLKLVNECQEALPLLSLEFGLLRQGMLEQAEQGSAYQRRYICSHHAACGTHQEDLARTHDIREVDSRAWLPENAPG